MRTVHRINSLGIGLALAAALLVLPAGDVSAQDADNDGFTDAEETAFGFSTSAKNLVVVIIPASPSRLPSNPLAQLSKPLDQGGLGLAVIERTPTQINADRTLPLPAGSATAGTTQKAVTLTEDVDAYDSGEIVGFCNQGTPNNLDDCIIFSRRIDEFIESVYTSNGIAFPTDLPTIKENYKKETGAHEVGHSLAVKKDYNARFGGNHDKAGSLVIMEQFVTYTVRGGKVTWSISNKFSDADKTDVRLK